MKKFLAILVLSLLWCNVSNSFPFIDTSWVIKKYYETPYHYSVFLEPETLISKTQQFHKGSGWGVFFNCSAEGRFSTYTTYKNWDEFLENKEFKAFKEAKDLLEFKENSEVYVNRISCAGKENIQEDGSSSSRDLLYPFVVFDSWNKGYILFEGAIYLLEHQ